jgi:hypothetical protein
MVLVYLRQNILGDRKILPTPVEKNFRKKFLGVCRRSVYYDRWAAATCLSLLTVLFRFLRCIQLSNLFLG